MLDKKNMTFLFIGYLLIVAAIVFFSWHFIFGKPNALLPTTQVVVQNNSSTSGAMASSSTASTVASTTASSTALGADQLSIDRAVFNIEIASTMLQQARGLSNRTSLAPNAGMLFIFSFGSVQNFWMKDMNFPLDMIWISGNTIVGFAENALAEPNVAFPSKIYSSPDKTDKVLEVNAGTVAKYNIKVGDAVTIGEIK